MARAERSSHHDLAAGRTWPLRRARGHRIVCLRGELWITIDGELADHFLQTGESFAIETDGRVVVYAVQESAFRTVAPASAPRVQRWWHVLRDAFA